MDEPKNPPRDLGGETYVPEAVQTPVPSSSSAPTYAGVSAAGAAPARTHGGPSPTFQAGAILAGRYRIEEVLGEGGMGAVYKALDTELDRVVALKVIRTELVGNPAILQRFKQELILARQITHRNVIRIYDLGEDLGIKFITMEFVEGEDLHHILKRQGKLPPAQAAEVMVQVCRALECAHAENVIHRDLKPQNVMRDRQGRILVMDFGLARTAESSGMTQTGALVGTIEYMSPEQALGKELDARSDLFAAGLVFYEVLTGKMPYKAESAVASLMKRNQERATPASQIDPEVPRDLSLIVGKCLEREPKNRYQSATEIIRDIESWQTGGRTGSTIKLPALKESMLRGPMKWMAWSILGLVMASGFMWFERSKAPSPAATQATPSGPVLSVAILPFRNGSGDASLDWLGPSLAEMLTTDVAQSAQLRLVSQDRLQQIARDLKVRSDEPVDPATAHRLGEFSNADTIVTGTYVRSGEQIRIDATLRNVKIDHSTTLKAEAPNDKELLAAVGQLAQQIRDTLGSGEAASAIRGKVFAPSSKSVLAVRYFNEGLQFTRQGDSLKARERFESATKEDPEFAMAYSRLALTLSALGYDTEAEAASRRAVDLSDKGNDRERLLIRANHARITNDNKKAIDAYESLAQLAPDDMDVQFTLAGLYESTGEFDKAKQHYTRVLSADPKYADALLAIGRVEIKSGNPSSSLEPLNKAFAVAVQLDNQEAKANILQATGVAYKLMGRLEDALSNYQQSLDIKKKIGQKRGMAVSLNEIGIVQGRLGHGKEALAAFEEALRLRREIGEKKGIGDTLIDLGNLYYDRGAPERALQLYKESLQIQRDLGDQAKQAMCLDDIGTIYFDKGEYEDARTNFSQALQIRESLKSPELPDTLHNLGETANKMGQFDDAIKFYMRALDLQRAAGAVRDAAIQSYSLGTVFGYEGRFGAALKAKEEAVKTFTGLKDQTPWMGEILAGYAESLFRVGKRDDATASLDKALSLAQQINNSTVTALATTVRGQIEMASGNSAAARVNLEKALQAAIAAKDKERTLTAKLLLAEVERQSGAARSAIPKLASLREEAQRLGLRLLAAECAVALGESYVDVNDFRAGRAQLESAIGVAEKLEARVLLTRAEYALATALRMQGNKTEAAAHDRRAVRYLDEIKADAGPNAITADRQLNSIYTEAGKRL